MTRAPLALSTAPTSGCVYCEAIGVLCLDCGERLALEKIEAAHRVTRDRADRLEIALREIAAGKLPGDNAHPLGAYASMAMRFVSIAQATLRVSTEGASK